MPSKNKSQVVDWKEPVPSVSCFGRFIPRDEIMIESNLFGLAAIIKYALDNGQRQQLDGLLAEAGFDLSGNELDQLARAKLQLASEFNPEKREQAYEFLAEFEELDEPTRSVLNFAFADQSQSRVLDIGCGAGRFLKIFKDREYKTFGLDVDQALVWLCRHRQLGPVESGSVFDWDCERKFDMVVLLGHNLGIGEDPDGVQRLLQKCRDCLVSGGLLLFNSIDVTQSEDPFIQARVKANLSRGRLPGESACRLFFGQFQSPVFCWYHTAYDEALSLAGNLGFHEELVEQDRPLAGFWSAVWRATE